MLFSCLITNVYAENLSDSATDESMHGPAVLSLLSGKDIGTAPEAEVYYYSDASWERDQLRQSEVLYQIIEKNKTLPVDYHYNFMDSGYRLYCMVICVLLLNILFQKIWKLEFIISQKVIILHLKIINKKLLRIKVSLSLILVTKK